jgi:predicted nucleic acid-binding protein
MYKKNQQWTDERHGKGGEWKETQHEYGKRIRSLTAHKTLKDSEANALLHAGLNAVLANAQIIPHAAYAPLLQEAQWRIPRDPDDWPCVALALALNCGIWTSDQDFFGCGLPTWTTETLSEWLQRHA